MKSDQFVYWCFSTILTSYTVFASEFTFELPDGTVQCFHEVVKENVQCTFEYQVTGVSCLDMQKIRSIWSLRSSCKLQLKKKNKNKIIMAIIQ